MPQQHNHFQNLAITSVVSLIYTQICSYVFSNEIFHESPMFSWFSCLPFQILILPFFAIWGYMSQKHSFNTWILSRWSNLNKRKGIVPEVLYLYIIHGYLFKDCFVGMYRNYWIHHALCWICIWSFLYVDTAPVFIIGSMLLELGSSTQTIFYLYQDSPWSLWLHVIAMTLSNAGAAYLVVFVYIKNGLGRIETRIFLGFVTMCLLAARQHAMYGNWSTVGVVEV